MSEYKTINYYIDEAKKESNSDSYNQLAKKLNVSGPAITAIRKGGTVSEKTLFKIAEVANKKVYVVLCSYKIKKATNKKEKEFWKETMKLSEQWWEMEANRTDRILEKAKEKIKSGSGE